MLSLTTPFLFGPLLLLFICLLFLYHWNRRHLYKSAKKLKSPISCWPIVGSLPAFSGGEIKVFETIYKVTMSCKGISTIWLGNQLFYCISKPEYVDKILNNNKFLNKPKMYNLLKPLLGDGLITESVHIWKKNRKFIAPTLHPRIIETFMDTFNEKIEDLIQKLNGQVGKTIDIFEYLAKCSSIISVETSMGVKIEEKDMTFLQTLDTALSLGIKRPFNLLYRSDFIYKLFRSGRQYFEACNFCSDFTKKVIENRRRKFEEEKKNDHICQIDKEMNIFIDQLLQLSATTGTNITNQILEDETKTLILAATDTSASTVGYFLMFMGMNPEIQDQVYEEVMDVVGPDRYVTSMDLLHLKYLDRAIKETLRICPPVPLILRSNEKDICLDDETTVSRGTTSGINIIGIHRNPKIWPDPYKFNPDRFLPEECVKRHPCSFIPFSSGPRNCVGRQYGLMVSKTMAVHLIRKYKFNTPIKSIESMKCKYNITMKPIDGILVNFVERLNHN